jgi:hypothetical protein
LFFRKYGKAGSHLLSANRDHDYSAKKRGAMTRKWRRKPLKSLKTDSGMMGRPLAVVVKQLGGAPG